MSTPFLPWWVGALALASVTAMVPLVLRRPFGVSGLLRAALLGPSSGGLSRTTSTLFLVGVVLGGALAAARFGSATGFDGTFTSLFGAGGGALAALLGGGVLVGAGTRIAGGCTSGHGLSGSARGQAGSLASTAGFFGTAVVVSLLLSRVLP